MQKLYVGIDPGASGALSAISNGHVIFCDKFPEEGGKINFRKISSILKEMKDDYDVIVAMEEVGAMPGQGVVSMFSFGRNVGNIEGMLEVLEIPHIKIRPQAWKKLTCGTVHKDKESKKTSADYKKEGKELAISWVRRRFPEASIVPKGCRKPSDGICDSICMAFACWALNP